MCYSVVKQLVFHSNQTADTKNVSCTDKLIDSHTVHFIGGIFKYLFNLSSGIFNLSIQTFIISLFLLYVFRVHWIRVVSGGCEKWNFGFYVMHKNHNKGSKTWSSSL